MRNGTSVNFLTFKTNIGSIFLFLKWLVKDVLRCLEKIALKVKLTDAVSTYHVRPREKCGIGRRGMSRKV